MVPDVSYACKKGAEPMVQGLPRSKLGGQAEIKKKPRANFTSMGFGEW